MWSLLDELNVKIIASIRGEDTCRVSSIVIPEPSRPCSDDASVNHVLRTVRTVDRVRTAKVRSGWKSEENEWERMVCSFVLFITGVIKVYSRPHGRNRK